MTDEDEDNDNGNDHSKVGGARVSMTYIADTDYDYDDAIGYVATILLSKKTDQNIVHLDNCAQVYIFMNSDFVANIRKANKPLQISGVGGEHSILCDKIADFNGMTVCFSILANGNILCMYDVMKMYHTVWDDSDLSWTVDFNDETRIFLSIDKM